VALTLASSITILTLLVARVGSRRAGSEENGYAVGYILVLKAAAWFSKSGSGVLLVGLFRGMLAVLRRRLGST
jgi:hypothetical protein